MSAMQFEVVIVGSGIAALSTAMAAAPRRVALVTRGELGSDGASHWAQGGIAAALGAGDTAQLHAQDTLSAGAHLNDRSAVARLTGGAASAVRRLEQIGVRFDRDVNGYALGREAAHSRARIVHASGDASGAAVMRCLTAALRAAAHVQVFEQHMVCALLQAQGRVLGVHAISGTDAPIIPAAATVLATGGMGALYRYTTNPASADASGLGLAIDAGAVVSDMEFVQFHPTALAPTPAASGQLPLLTEALRGAGAVLVDHLGRRFMPGYAADAELAPRDIVARAVWQELQTGRRVFLDARGIAGEFASRFPTVHAICAARGIDPRREPIPVVPAQHYHMGGVKVDASGASSVPGLYAVGEVACSGVHGANRLASNSLLEGLVFGQELGLALSRLPVSSMAQALRAATPTAAGVPAAVDLRLRDLLWQHAGLVRDAAGLQRAREELAALREPSRDWPQAQSRIRVAQILVSAALDRRASIGAHFRRDTAQALSA